MRTKTKRGLICGLCAVMLACGGIATSVLARFNGSDKLANAAGEARAVEWLTPAGFETRETQDGLEFSKTHEGVLVIPQDITSNNIEFDIVFHEISTYGFPIFMGGLGGDDMYDRVGVRLQQGNVNSMDYWDGQVGMATYANSQKLFPTDDDEGKKNPVSNTFHIVFGVEKVNDTTNKIYFSMTEKTTGTVWVNETKDTEITKTNRKEKPEIRIGDNMGANNTHNKFTITVKNPALKSVAAIEHDEDISYYWSQSNNEARTLTEPSGNGNLTGLLQPMNNRVSFAFSTGLWDVQGNDGENYNFFYYGNDYDAYGFQLDYQNNNVRIFDHDGFWRGVGPCYDGETLFRTVYCAQEYPYTFDRTKTYLIGYAVRDVLNESEEVAGKVMSFSIAEQGNESNKLTVNAYTPLIVENGNLDKMTFNIQGYNSGACAATISSVEKWWNVTTVVGDERNTVKTKGTGFALTAATGDNFIGWSADGKLYDSGAFTLTKDTTFTAVYLSVALPNSANLRLGKTALRFTANAQSEQMTELADHVSFVLTVTANDTSVKTDTFTVAQLTEGKFFTTVDVANTAYETVYKTTAKAVVTFEDGTTKEIDSVSFAQTSAKHIAKQALADTAKNWNRAERAALEAIAGTDD